MMVFFTFGLMMVVLLNLSWVFVFFFLMLMTLSFFLMLDFEFESCHVFFFGLGFDIMSMFLILLSIWILILMIMSSFLKENSYLIIFVFLLIFFILEMCFFLMNFLGFYMVFEFVLIPTIILIVGWGYQPERLSAGLYLMFYTVFCSMPLLVLILWENKIFGLMLMVGYNKLCFMSIEVMFLVMISFISFLVSIPLFGFHLWLLKAHVEAPVSGSMILAGVLLKLGCYGLIRFIIYWWDFVGMVVTFMILFSLFGSMLMSFVCLRQSDLSALIAYSSVVHMGMVIGGIMSSLLMGWIGGYIMMIGHGLCSSGLFYYVGLLYDSLGSRSLMLNSGLMLMFPSSVIFWFLLVSSNMSFPPSLGLFGELVLMGSMLSVFYFMMYLLFFVSFFGGVYCLFLYSWVQHGMIINSMKLFNGINYFEMVVIMMHWLPLNLFFLSMDLFLV